MVSQNVPLVSYHFARTNTMCAWVFAITFGPELIALIAGAANAPTDRVHAVFGRSTGARRFWGTASFPLAVVPIVV